MIEIIFKASENINKYIELKKYAQLISDLNIFGKGVEHDSTHYLENTYFKWEKDDLKVKLYWNDYDIHTFCLDILLNEKRDINPIINILKNKIENLIIKE